MPITMKQWLEEAPLRDAAHVREIIEIGILTDGLDELFEEVGEVIEVPHRVPRGSNLDPSDI